VGVVPSFSTVLEDLVNRILANPEQGLDYEDVHASREKFSNLFIYADTLRHSRFLDTLVSTRNPRNIDRQERAERLKRRLCKVCHTSATSPHKESQAFRPDSLPLGHGHFYWT
jgi:hypothetical protein